MAKNTDKQTIKIEGEKWTDALDKIFKKKQKEVQIDGFRKGSIPKDIYLEKVGIESLYMDAIDLVLDDAVNMALEKSKVKPAISPSVDVSAIDKDSVTFEISIIGQPPVKLGEYKNLKIKKPSTKVTEKEIEEEINNLRTELAEIKIKDGETVEDKDIAIIDFKGYVDNELLDGGSGENYSLEIGSHTFIPGFEEGLIGMKINETKTLHLKFPKDYTKNLANKDVDFEVTIKEIKTRVLPEIDEDFFADLGYDKVTNATELHDEVKKMIEERKKQNAEDKYIDEVLKTASNNLEVEIYEEIIDDEVHRMIHQFEDQLQKQGLSMDKYMEFSNLTHEDLHKNMEPEAINRIKMRYLLEAVAEAEKIEVTDEEALKDAEEMAKNYGISKEELIDAYGSMEIIKYDAKMRKTLEFLKNN